MLTIDDATQKTKIYTKEKNVPKAWPSTEQTTYFALTFSACYGWPSSVSNDPLHPFPDNWLENSCCLLKGFQSLKKFIKLLRTTTKPAAFLNRKWNWDNQIKIKSSIVIFLAEIISEIKRLVLLQSQWPVLFSFFQFVVRQVLTKSSLWNDEL